MTWVSPAKEKGDKGGEVGKQSLPLGKGKRGFAPSTDKKRVEGFEPPTPK